jgi:hypothetical protein
MRSLSRHNRQSSLTNWDTWDKVSAGFDFGVRLSSVEPFITSAQTDTAACNPMYGPV